MINIEPEVSLDLVWCKVEVMIELKHGFNQSSIVRKEEDGTKTYYQELYDMHKTSIMDLFTKTLVLANHVIYNQIIYSVMYDEDYE